MITFGSGEETMDSRIVNPNLKNNLFRWKKKFMPTSAAGTISFLQLHKINNNSIAGEMAPSASLAPWINQKKKKSDKK